MQVNPSNSFSPVSAGSVTNNQTAATGKADAPAGPLSDSAFTPTGDLSRLLAQVRELPDVRADLIEQVSARLSEAASPQAAADAAKALLDSGDLGR